MTEPQEQFSHAAMVLVVNDIEKSIKFYSEQLGFAITFSTENPRDYAVLKRGGVGVHLSEAHEKVEIKTGDRSLYVFVYDPDALLKEFVNNGVVIDGSIEDRVYGMRDFDILDPDGHKITFGRGN